MLYSLHFHKVKMQKQKCQSQCKNRKPQNCLVLDRKVCPSDLNLTGAGTERNEVKRIAKPIRLLKPDRFVHKKADHE